MRRHLGLAGLVLSLAACGGGEEISKEEYLGRAQAICRQGNEELEAASKKAFADVKEGEKPSDEQVGGFVRRTVVPMIRAQVEELRDLPPPEKAADQVDEIYDAVEVALDELEADPKRLTVGPNLFAEADRLGEKYGFPVCSAGG